MNNNMMFVSSRNPTFPNDWEKLNRLPYNWLRNDSPYMYMRNRNFAMKTETKRFRKILYLRMMEEVTPWLSRVLPSHIVERFRDEIKNDVCLTLKPSSDLYDTYREIRERRSSLVNEIDFNTKYMRRSRISPFPVDNIYVIAIKIAIDLLIGSIEDVLYIFKKWGQQPLIKVLPPSFEPNSRYVYQLSCEAYAEYIATINLIKIAVDSFTESGRILSCCNDIAPLGYITVTETDDNAFSKKYAGKTLPVYHVMWKDYDDDMRALLVRESEDFESFFFCVMLKSIDVGRVIK